MRQALHHFHIETRGKGFYDVTRVVAAWARDQGMTTGLLTLFCRHTSASLVIQENADPAVLRDLETAFARLAPEGDGLYEHDSEGADDMPAHIRAALTRRSSPFRCRAARSPSEHGRASICSSIGAARMRAKSSRISSGNSAHFIGFVSPVPETPLRLRGRRRTDARQTAPRSACESRHSPATDPFWHARSGASVTDPQA